MNRRGFLGMVAALPAVPVAGKAEAAKVAAPATAPASNGAELARMFEQGAEGIRKARRVKFTVRGAPDGLLQRLPEIIREHHERLIDDIRRGRYGL